jgi:hypothetical protein
MRRELGLKFDWSPTKTRFVGCIYRVRGQTTLLGRLMVVLRMPPFNGILWWLRCSHIPNLTRVAELFKCPWRILMFILYSKEANLCEYGSKT